MARHVNVRHKNFLAELQAKMKERYKPNYNQSAYSETDRRHAEMIGVDLPEPVAPSIPERRGSGKPAHISIDAFEKEYEEFIANLKAQKQAKESKEEEVTNVPETNVETTQAVEETPVVEDKPKKTKKKKKVVETVQEEPVVEETSAVEEPVVEQTESPVYPDDGQTEGEKSDLPEVDSL